MLHLTRSRKKAGLSLEEIADVTKISLRFLRAIESEEFEKLPGGIFTTSYIRQYAVAIGYDETELLAHYTRTTNPPASLIQKAPAEKASRSLLDRWLGIPATIDLK
ncbi:MAG TPA: helix-turn-helix transcriptional regulator [Bryobacteraceae bacterium]|nr:helix-turn-helix transcriptional regulator [Bryobacteraceae bacterium]